MPTNEFKRPVVPDKLYFKIGEVSQLTDLPAYVLRFWETEFKGVNPKRTSTGQRMYRKSDLELILTIRHLLYEKKYTIPGARQHLKDIRKQPPKPPSPATLGEVRDELKKIRDMLE